MDLLHLAPVPVIDSHVHFPHRDVSHSLLDAVERIGYAAVNLVALPDMRGSSQNAAVMYHKRSSPARTYISGAFDYTQVLDDPQRGPDVLARQVCALKDAGFDGLKLIEGKPTARQQFGVPLDDPLYAPMWEALEAQRFPVVWHVADPGEFWDLQRCPDWARAHGWFYGADGFPSRQQLYDEVECVLERHPGLRVILAHFYFLSDDLPRAEAFLKAHPGAYLDLAPGVEMYVNFAQDVEATRSFFVRHAGRIVYGTDIGAATAESERGWTMNLGESLGRVWIVRHFLESNEAFDAPVEMGHGLGMDAAGLHGIALPPEALERIYCRNFQALFGERPADLPE
ncbi:MAG: amidohydrolase family protein [Anaerolineales bacterium]|nr:amidohydrolase family protein [Anaerolineales bacterium]